MKNSPPPPWLETQEVMAQLRISKQTLSRLRKRGLLKAHKIPGMRRVYFSPTDVDSLIALHVIDENGKLDLVGIEKPP